MAEKKNVKFTLRNQTAELDNFTDEDIIDFLEYLYDDYDDFVVLSAEDEPIDNVSFVQAFWNKTILHTEIGVQTAGNPKITLYEKNMSMEDGKKLFLDFFHGKWSGNISDFTLCEMQP